jgi:hypothetical protein
LKNRFRTKVEKEQLKPTVAVASSLKKQCTFLSSGAAGLLSYQSKANVVEAPLLPTEQKPAKSSKEDMEDFLDDLLG